MEPFKVTFSLSAPVVRDSEYPIHLDALLAYAVMKEAEELGAENPWVQADDLSSLLADTRQEGGDWVWQASMLIFEAASEKEFCNMIRRSDPDRYLGDLADGSWGSKRSINPKTFKIDSRSGQHRGYQWLAVAQWMRQATAYGVGDIEAVREYLRKIEYLGKMGRNGHGRIAAISVEPAGVEEAELWRLRVLPMHLPGHEGVIYEPVQACLRAPYWRKVDQAMAKEPLI